MRVRRGGWLLVVLGVAALGEVQARVKLITLPVRERVEIRLDREGATLVEEERRVPLTRGRNEVDFAWTGTSIDPGSIVFRVVGDGPGAPPAAGAGGGPKVLSVSYPPGEQALVWTVHAPVAGSARVRISYLLGGLERSFSYRAVATHDERRMTLSQYLQVRNRARESFGESGIWVADGQRLTRPVGDAETRELLVERWDDLPVRKTYSVDLAGLGWLHPAKRQLRVAMHYVIDNALERGLGRRALPRGKARIYQADGHAGTVFLGEDWGKHTPPGDEMPLYLGSARDVVVTRTVEANERRDVDGELFDQAVTIKYEIENFKVHPVDLDVAEDLEQLRAELLGQRAHPLEWELGAGTDFPQGIDGQRTRATRVVAQTRLPAADGGRAASVVHRLQVVLKNEW